MPDRGIFTFVLWATLAILAMSVIGFLCARRIREWYRGDGGEAGGAPFTLQDLRAMRARGEISEAEYETMRAAIIGHVASVGPRRQRPVSGARPAGEESARPDEPPAG